MSEILKTLRMYRGDSYPISITISDSETGLAIDITGYSFKLTVNSDQNPTSITNQKFTVVGILDSDPTTGKVSFTPTSLNTDISPATYYYDIEMTDASNNIKTIAKSTFIILQDITK